MFDTFLLDVDGTLVDSNYFHAIAWARAFGRHGYTPPVWRIHRAIGMGGDQLVPAVVGEEAEHKLGDKLRSAWEEEYEALLGEVQPLAGAEQLLRELRERGVKTVIATSSPPEHLDHYLPMFDGRRLADAMTDADEADASKPEPDLIERALEKVETRQAVMVGDSVWDVEAATRAGILTLGVCTGGYSASELREAGAIRVYESLPDLLQELDLWTIRPAR